MKRKKPRRLNGLREVQWNYHEEDLDQQFSVLPGETWVGEVNCDLEAETEVRERFLGDEKCEEAAREGQRLEGLWRHVVCDRRDAEVDDRVVRWTLDEVRMKNWRVMSPHCVEIVRQVMSVKNV